MKNIFLILAVFLVASCGPGDSSAGDESSAAQSPPTGTAPAEKELARTAVDGNVLLLGDSIMWDCSDGINAKFVFGTKSYLPLTHGIIGSGVVDASRYWVPRIKSVQKKFAFDFVVLNLGHNDVIYKDMAPWQQQINSILDVIPDDVPVIWALPHSGACEQSGAERCDLFKSLLQSAAQTHANVQLIDFDVYLQGIGSSIDKVTKEDGLHLNHEGSLLYSQMLYDAVVARDI